MAKVYHATQLPLFVLSKICISCHKNKDIDDFPIDRSKPTGHRARCKVCWNTFERTQTTLTREKHNAYQRTQRAKNPEHQRSLYQSQYLGRREVRLVEMQKWTQSNPVKRAELSNRRRARKQGVMIGEMSYKRILERDGYWCYICEQDILIWQKMEFDHVIPLSRGGAHSEENIKPTHKECNRRKKACLLEEMTSFQRRGPD